MYLPDAARVVILASMESLFKAFAVSKGDCFLLELAREGKDAKPFRILVDTGDQAYEAASKLSEHFTTSRADSRPTLDVVAITHADSDHMRGLAAVLKSNVRVLELWLPYQVGKAMTMAFQEPVKIAHKVAQLVNNVPDEAVEQAVRQVKIEYLKELESQRDGDGPVLIRGAGRVGDLLLNKLYQNLEDSASEEGKIQANLSESKTLKDLRGRVIYRRRIHGWRDSINRVISEHFYARWNDRLHFGLGPFELDILTGPHDTGIARGAMVFAMCTKAQQIKNTLTQSFDYQEEMNIRFFDYVHEVVSPQPQLTSILPVGIINAVEKISIPKGTNPSDVLALLPMDESTISIIPDRSSTNHTSLVLHAPATEYYPAVLFSADSDFTFAQNGLTFPWSPGMLITAPHHGSQANSGLAQLYSRAHAAHHVPSSCWVRSDSKQDCSGSRPGTWWRVDLDSSVGVKKYCTTCRSKAPIHRDVEFTIDSQGNWETGTTDCNCK